MLCSIIELLQSNVHQLYQKFDIRSSDDREQIGKFVDEAYTACVDSKITPEKTDSPSLSAILDHFTLMCDVHSKKAENAQKTLQKMVSFIEMSKIANIKNNFI